LPLRGRKKTKKRKKEKKNNVFFFPIYLNKAAGQNKRGGDLAQGEKYILYGLENRHKGFFGFAKKKSGIKKVTEGGKEFLSISEERKNREGEKGVF